MRRFLHVLISAVSLVVLSPPATAGETRSHAATGETFGAKLRRLEIGARYNNPLVNQPLIGAKPWIILSGAWTASTAVTVGQLVSNGGVAYICTTAGTTAASGGPTGTSPTTIITDGTAHWIYYVGSVGDQVSNNGWVFQVMTAGVPATTGSGPTPISLTDGSITYALVGKQTAPVVTFQTSANGTYSNVYNPVNYLADNTGLVRYSGGVPSIKATNYVGLPSVNVAPAAGSFIGNLSCFYESATFVVEDAQMQIGISGGIYMRLVVDGAYVGNGAYTGNLTTPFAIDQQGASTYFTLNWANAGGRSRHTVTIEFQGSGLLRQLATNPTGSLSYPNVSANFSVAEIGDSMSAATQATDSANGFFERFAKRVGLPDNSIVGIGGTGVINAGTSTAYGGHALSDLANLNAFRPIGLIFIQASGNDSSYVGVAGEIQAAALTLIQSIRTAYPTVPIIVHGYAVNNASSTQTTIGIPIENDWAAAVAQQNAAGDSLTFWIPLTAATPNSMITGTGHVGGTTGNGNADYDISSDVVHPTDSGYDLWSYWLAAGYRNVIAQMP